MSFRAYQLEKIREVVKVHYQLHGNTANDLKILWTS